MTLNFKSPVPDIEVEPSKLTPMLVPAPTSNVTFPLPESSVALIACVPIPAAFAFRPLRKMSPPLVLMDVPFNLRPIVLALNAVACPGLTVSPFHVVVASL